jgi:hypothetical protein
MNEKIFKRDSKTILSFLFAFAILYLLITRANLRETVRIISNADLILYLLAILYLFPSFLIRSYRWKILLENVRYTGKLRDLNEVVVLSFFVNCIVPAKVGDIYRCYLMKKNFQQSISKVLGTVFVERSLDTIGISVIFLLSAFMSFRVIPGNVLRLMEFGVIITVLFILLLILLKYQNTKIAKFMPGKSSELMLRFGEGASGSLKSSSLPMISITTIFLWLLEGGRLFLVMKSIGLILPFAMILFVALASALATAFPLTPAGLGAVELVMAGLLILVGINKDMAVSVAIMDRFISYWCILILGGIIYALSSKT